MPRIIVPDITWPRVAYGQDPSNPIRSRVASPHRYPADVPRRWLLISRPRMYRASSCRIVWRPSEKGSAGETGGTDIQSTIGRMEVGRVELDGVLIVFR
jgi:hypothetical protein